MQLLINHSHKLTSRQVYLALTLYTILVTTLFYILFSNWTYDDPFITYRYAQNLAHGQGFVYNIGEHILSTTTPLFTLLLAGLTPIWSDIHHLSILLGAFGLALGAVLIWMLASDLGSRYVGWVGLLLYPTFPLVARTLGSEITIYLALCLVTFVFYFRHRYNLAAICAALTVLARPDGMLVPVIIAIDYFYKLVHDARPFKSIPWKAILIFIAILLAWILFALFYFGSPIPVTLAAKQQQSAITGSESFLHAFPRLFSQYDASPFLLSPILAIAGVVFAGLKAPRWMIIFGWTILYFIAYSTLGVTRYFWYYAPLVPGFIIAVGLGLDACEALWHSIKQRFSASDSNTQPRRRSSYLHPDVDVRIIASLLLVLLVVLQSAGLWQMRKNPDLRYAIYRAAGEWLDENTASQASVGMLEVGIIGYYAHRQIVDFAGQIQPEVAAQLSLHHTYDGAALWAVHTYHPDYLVIQTGSLPNLEQQYVSANCQAVATLQGDDYKYPQNLAIYRCQ